MKTEDKEKYTDEDFETTVEMFICQEEERLERAINITKQTYIFDNLSDEELDEEEASTQFVSDLLNLSTVKTILNRLNMLFTKMRYYRLFSKDYLDRPNWENLCIAFRKLFLEFSKSFVATSILPVAELDETVAVVEALGEYGLVTVNNLQQVFRDIQKHLKKYTEARMQFLKYHEDLDDQTSFDNDLVNLYAILTTWPTEEKKKAFLDKLFDGLSGLLYIGYIGLRSLFLAGPLLDTEDFEDIFALMDKIVKHCTLEKILRSMTESLQSITTKEVDKEINAAAKIITIGIYEDASSGINSIYQNLISLVIAQYVGLLDEFLSKAYSFIKEEQRESFKEKFEEGRLY